MSDEEIIHRYVILGLTRYIELTIKKFHAEHGRPPSMVVVGRLEWEDIMGCSADSEYTVAGVPVVPNLSHRRLVEACR